MYDPSQPPLVSETLLKKRRSLDELALRRAEQLRTQVKRRRVVRGENVKIIRPEKLVTQYRIADGSKKKFNRKRSEAENKLSRRGFVVPVGEVKSTAGFIVRVHEAKNATPIIKSQLKGLGLDEKYKAGFFRLDQAMLGE
jgi:hypothetical protein